jgi:cyclic pyranopterin phosphate synthase
MISKLTHVDDLGNTHMVDVSDKPSSERTAIAKGEIVMKLETLELISQSKLKKGDVITTAKLAGILAAKQTLLNPLPFYSFITYRC